MPAKKLKDFLDRNRIKYVTLTHSPAYTAQGIAQSAHISGKEMAKTVIVKVGSDLAMVVLPANQKVDVEALRHVTGADRVSVAEERDFERAFPGCELGAMPPFGNLWDVPVFVEETLAENEQIVFNAGTHTELIRLDFRDFEALVKPTIASLTFAVT